MKNNDTPTTREEIRAAMQKALKEDDKRGFSDAFDQMLLCIQQEVKGEYDQSLNDLRQELDSRILTARGVRQLTTEERDYYQKLAQAMQSGDPRQAVNNMDVVMPKTVINSVFDDLSTNHPLLSKIGFTATSGAVEIIMNENGYQEAVWGALTDDIVKEATSGFKKVRTDLLKTSAFLPVCKAMLDMGPEWLDRYVREVLYETLANGMETGIVSGDGKDQPIGMIRQVGEGVTVTGGRYPKKVKISITTLSAETIGNLLSIISVDPNGKTRKISNVIFVVNPVDYFRTVMPATTIMGPDGTYRNDVMPYPMDIIQSPAVDIGEAVMGIAYRYFGAAGTAKEGRIEYSDHYHFLEDERVYLIKAYANGMPMDNNAFLLLDISGLKPATWKVEQVSARTLSGSAALSDLKIGSLTLSPAFAAATTTYTATTTNSTNTITAMPTDAGAEIEVQVGDTVIANGSAAAWAAGDNTVTITVTAEDGTTTKVYTVTVTKS